MLKDLGVPYTGILPLQSHPGGLLFTKFGGSQTALLDLAFPVMILSFEKILSLWWGLPKL